MRIKPEYVLYTDEQAANLAILIVEDDNPDAPTIALDEISGQLYAIVRTSNAAEDEAYLRESLEIMRIDWLKVLGYDDTPEPFDPGFTRGIFPSAN